MTDKCAALEYAALASQGCSACQARALSGQAEMVAFLEWFTNIPVGLSPTLPQPHNRVRDGLTTIRSESEFFASLVRSICLTLGAQSSCRRVVRQCGGTSAPLVLNYAPVWQVSHSPRRSPNSNIPTATIIANPTLPATIRITCSTTGEA